MAILDADKTKKEVEQLKKVVQQLINRLAILEQENRRLKNAVHQNKIDIGHLSRKQ